MEITFGIIDVGSNSVRLLVSSGGKTLYKTAVITRLSDGLGKGNAALSDAAVFRSAKAVSYFCDVAKSYGATAIRAFGTAALRQADPTFFIETVKKLCGVTVEVVAGDIEAELGFLGAVGTGDGGIIDIGGASTEVIIKSGGKNLFSKSFDIGAVKLFDLTGENPDKMRYELNSRLNGVPDSLNAKFFGIGGTITSLAAIDQKLIPYDPNKTNGYVLTDKKVSDLTEFLLSTPEKERGSIAGLQKGRERIIACGAYILKKVMEKFKIGSLTVSESDNLEGYLRYITEIK